MAPRTRSLIVDALEYLSAEILIPDSVVTEMRNKANEDSRLQLSKAVLDGVLDSGRMREIDSKAVPGSRLAKNVESMIGSLYEDRKHRQKHLGELVVLAHARTYWEEGHNVIVLIDDLGGQARGKDGRHIPRYVQHPGDRRPS